MGVVLLLFFSLFVFGAKRFFFCSLTRESTLCRPVRTTNGTNNAGNSFLFYSQYWKQRAHNEMQQQQQWKYAGFPHYSLRSTRIENVGELPYAMMPWELPWWFCLFSPLGSKHCGIFLIMWNSHLPFSSRGIVRYTRPAVLLLSSSIESHIRDARVQVTFLLWARENSGKTDRKQLPRSLWQWMSGYLFIIFLVYFSHLSFHFQNK